MFPVKEALTDRTPKILILMNNASRNIVWRLITSGCTNIRRERLTAFERLSFTCPSTKSYKSVKEGMFDFERL